MASELIELITPGLLPHLVQINLQTGTHLCAGSIIAPHLILTAAICVYQPELADKLSVIAGNPYSKPDYATEQSRKVREIIIHEKYAPFHVDYNLALLVLEKPLEFTETVHNLGFPSIDSKYEALGTMAGWKSVKKDRKMSFNDLSIWKKETCETYWNETLLSQFEEKLDVERIFCGSRQGKGPCFGDEGQPLICSLEDDENKDPYLCGIVTLGDEACTTGLFTDVRKNLEWIMEQFIAVSFASTESSTIRYMKCSNGAYVDKSLRCDGYDDCGDESDESPKICLGYRYFEHSENEKDEDLSQLQDYLPCFTNSSEPVVYKYIPASNLCNGVEDCLMGTDELNCEECQESAFSCHNKQQCVPESAKCNGVNDCEDGSDEVICTEDLNSVDDCALHCRGTNKCISFEEICNGKDDCGDNSDEECDVFLKHFLSKIRGSEGSHYYP